MGTKDTVEQKTAGKKLQAPPMRDKFPLHGQYKWRGLTILVENAKGTWRLGKGWKTHMKFDYGEVEGSLGSDGDPVDVYVGPNEKAKNVYVIHQNHVFGPKKGQYDEDKVMLGFANARAAKRAYLAHYNRADFLRSVTEMPFESFKKMIFEKENQGEKLAMEKKAEHLDIVDLFFSGKTASRRQRIWKNPATGHQTEFTGSGLGDTPSTMHKTAGAKVATSKAASHEKVGDIDKEVEPSGTVGRVSAALTGKEPHIPPAILDTMARCGLQEALATPSLMGMSLKPEEFQRLLLSHIGRKDEADSMDREGITFSPTSGCSAPCGGLDKGDFSKSIMRMLMPQLEDRSYLSPVLVRRVTRVSIMPPGGKSSTPVQSPLLTKISRAYNWYRQEMVKSAARYAGDTVSDNPELSALVFGHSASDVFFSKEADLRPHAVLATVPLALMYSSSIRGDMEEGRNPGLLKRTIADHPFLAALGAAALTKRILYNQGMQKALERAAEGAKGGLSLAAEGAGALSQVAKVV